MVSCVIFYLLLLCICKYFVTLVLLLHVPVGQFLSVSLVFVNACLSVGPVLFSYLLADFLPSPIMSSVPFSAALQ